MVLVLAGLGRPVVLGKGNAPGAAVALPEPPHAGHGSYGGG